MKISHIFIAVLAGMSVSVPAYAASWGGLEKGACEATSGKRAYKAKLKRNFGDESGANLCPRLHKTVNGKSRVPDRCEKKGLGGYTGIWLEPDTSCAKKAAAREMTPIKNRKPS